MPLATSLKRLVDALPFACRAHVLLNRSRLQIRHDISEMLGVDVTNLDRPPSPPGWSISLTHSKDVAIWIATIEPFRLGIDLEDLDRIGQRLITRITRPTERLLPPDPRFLWSAKEAAFKCLRPRTTSAVTISDWRAECPHQTFKFHLNGTGLFVPIAHLSLAIAYLPQTPNR